MSTRIKLPADIFDALELACEMSGGIGEKYFSHPLPINLSVLPQTIPCCVHGHARYIVKDDGFNYRIQNILFKAGITYELNDTTVAKWRKRQKDKNALMPWEAFCKSLNIVRGK